MSYSSRRSRSPGPDLHHLDRKLVALDAQAHRGAENPLGAARPVERDRDGPVLQPHRAEQAGDAQHVVGVIVGEEHFGEGEPDAVPHHLALGALAAVEEDRLPFALHRQPRDVPVDGGAGGARAEEGDAERSKWRNKLSDTSRFLTVTGTLPGCFWSSSSSFFIDCDRSRMSV